MVVHEALYKFQCFNCPNGSARSIRQLQLTRQTLLFMCTDTAVCVLVLRIHYGCLNGGNSNEIAPPCIMHD